jgi:lysophospholipase L1-like esterase
MKLCLAAAVLAAIPLAAAPARIALVGDSTVNGQGGWGPGFRALLSDGVEVTNFAKNGRSSKSFRDEGLWAPVLAAKPDYVLIQFGHNDVPGKGADRETDAATTYRANLVRYIQEARDAGAQPILVTSIVRRNFTADGKIERDSLVPYVEAARAVAAEQHVLLIDLYELTLQQAESLGPAGCADIDARDKDGKRDHTHLGPKGQKEIGAIAVREFIKLEPALRPYYTGDSK